MGVAGKHGITTETPKNIPLGAGTIHKGLKYDNTSQKWNLEESIIGATAGGNKVSIKGEIFDIELDGALVKVKGLAVKNGGTATMENNFAVLSRDILKMATLFEDVESEDEAYRKLQDKAKIEDGDYLENYAFVGKTANENKNIIVICDGDEYCIWTDLKKFGLINMDNIQLAIPEKEWWEDGYEYDDDPEDVDVTEEWLQDNKKEGED